jgi:hypothetical protein
VVASFEHDEIVPQRDCQGPASANRYPPAMPHGVPAQRHGGGDWTHLPHLVRDGSAGSAGSLTAAPFVGGGVPVGGSAAPTLAHMTKVIAFDVNETLLDLSALDASFEEVLGSADLRGQWFAQMLQLSFVGGLSGEYVDFSTAQHAALSCSPNETRSLSPRLR